MSGERGILKLIFGGGGAIGLIGILANLGGAWDFVSGTVLKNNKAPEAKPAIVQKVKQPPRATVKRKRNSRSTRTRNPGSVPYSTATQSPVAASASAAAAAPLEAAIPEFTLTVSNIIGFPQTAYTLKDRLLGLPGVRDVRISQASFQTDTKSAKYYIKFDGGDNKQIIRHIRGKILLFTFERQVKYMGERDIKMWVAF